MSVYIYSVYIYIVSVRFQLELQLDFCYKAALRCELANDKIFLLVGKK